MPDPWWRWLVNPFLRRHLYTARAVSPQMSDVWVFASSVTASKQSWVVTVALRAGFGNSAATTRLRCPRGGSFTAAVAFHNAQQGHPWPWLADGVSRQLLDPASARQDHL